MSSGEPRGSGDRVLVVGAGPFQLDVIDAALSLGTEVIVVDRRADAPGMARADHAVAIDTSDVAAVVEVARRFRVTGVVTAASDVAVGAVAAVAEALGLRGLRPEVARRCRDKLATFAWLRARSLAVPDTLPVQSARDAVEAVAALGGCPIVVKPRSSAGGRGVSIVERPERLERALERALSYASPEEGALVQRFVGGISVGVEAFFVAGELAAAFVMDDQYQDGFVSPVGHSLPSTLAAPALEAVRRDVARFASAIGLSDGPANFDLRRDGETTVLLEVNARLGGNSITDLVRACHGVDLATATVLGAVGQDPRTSLAPAGEIPTAARLMLARGRGRARVGSAGDRWRTHPGVLSLDVVVRDGELPTLVADAWTILGRCIVRAKTVGEAAELARTVADDVSASIRLEPDSLRP